MSHHDTRVLILGVDGYLGWALHEYLSARGYQVTGYDNFLRRTLVRHIGSNSLIPIDSVESRGIQYLDMTEDSGILTSTLKADRPDAIVHLAEIPSAPYSMASCYTSRQTQYNNLMGTLNLIWSVKEVCPEAHIIKLGTMGEYGDSIYEDTPIPESGRVTVGYPIKDTNQSLARCINQIEIPTPRWTGSFYHWSKIFDSYNLDFASRLWGLRVTDLNQGPVYGTRLSGQSTRMTRFDYDEYFGTVINRFCVQAMIGLPLTVYGEGGQTRGYINLNDSMRAIEIAINHPPEAGEFRVVNQITEVFSVMDIAILLQETVHCIIDHIDNPRVEREHHPYQPTHEWLKARGLSKFTRLHEALGNMLDDVGQFSQRAIRSVILPKTYWREKEKVNT